VIELRNVWFSYDGRTPALDVPALTIGPGLTAIVGPNGAGKSTLIRTISGVERPKRGTVTINGIDLWADEIASRRQLALVTEYPELTPYASLVDLLQLVARLRGATDADVAAALDHVGLLEIGRRTVRELSMGQRRRAMLATALIGTPPIVILDEPLETLDANMREFVRDWVLRLRRDGRSVLVATHDLGAFVAATDAVVAVRAGQATMHVVRDELPAARAELLGRLARGA
jgi:ABC-2 type transport system ATP-binding protein